MNKSIIKYFPAAACMFALIIISFVISGCQNPTDNNSEDTSDSNKNVSEETANNSVAECMVVEYDSHAYEYILTELSESEIESAGYYPGDLISENGGQSIYKLDGRDDMAYIYIIQDGRTYIGRYVKCNDEEISYDYILKNIYNVQSADNIESVTYDIEESGEDAQDADISKLSVTDREEIEKIYNILISLTQVSDEAWEQICDSDKVRNAAANMGDINETLYIRNISVHVSSGEDINFIYNSSYGAMTQYNGAYFSLLSDSDNEYLKQLGAISY